MRACVRACMHVCVRACMCACVRACVYCAHTHAHIHTHPSLCYCSYPKKVWSLLHHAHCLLPLPAAHVLSCNPQLIAPAVHALCDRDPNDMKVGSPRCSHIGALMHHSVCTYVRTACSHQRTAIVQGYSSGSCLPEGIVVCLYSHLQPALSAPSPPHWCIACSPSGVSTNASLW